MGSGERPKAPETEAAAGRAGDAMRGGCCGRRARWLGFPPVGCGCDSAMGSEDSHGKGSDDEMEGGGVGGEEWKPRDKRSKS